MPIDCHAHFELYGKKFEEEIERAKTCVSLVFDSITEYRKAHVWKSWEKLKPYFDFAIPTLGFHPNEARRGNWERVKKVEEFILEHSDEIVAVGEIGLDYHHARSLKERENQLEIFRHFLDLANQIDRPVIIHARNAEEVAVREVERSDTIAYFHAFANPACVNIAQQLGFVGISTGIVFIPEVVEVAEKCDVERILVETDSPYMSPFKGKVNTPCNVSIVIDNLEKLKKYKREELVEVLNSSAEEFFGVKCSSDAVGRDNLNY